MGYRVTWSRVLLGHRVTGSSGLSPAFSPSPISPGSSWSQGLGSPWVTITMVSGHGLPWSQGYHHHGFRLPESRVIGSPWSRVTGHPGYRVTGYHESPLPGSRVTMGYGVTPHHGSRVSGHYGLGSQGLHGHRVTHHPGSRISHHPGYRVTITMVSGHIQPWSHHGGVLRLDPTSTPSLK